MRLRQQQPPAKSRVAPRRETRIVRRNVVQFLLAGFVALVVLTLASLLASRQAGENEAIRDAQERTELLARRVVEPHLTPSLIASERAAVDELGTAMWELTETESFAHLRIWTADGLIIYSDQEGLAGTTPGLSGHAQEAFDNGESTAEVSDLEAEENFLERDEGKLLEVYHPVRATDGTPLLLETYYPYANVVDSAQQIWWDFLPAVLIPLLLLQLIQIPLAVRLARKVQHAQDEREELLHGIISASDNERKAIARDLHDGAVQDLSGTTYALSVVTERASRNGDDRSVELLSGAQTDIRRSIKSLRSLFVEIYPPNLQRAGLQVALADLLAPLDGRGITSTLNYPDRLELPMDINATVYRITQEATRNVTRHANASHITVDLTTSDTMVSLQIVDDGTGFDTNATAESATPGHLGLPIMGELAEQAGGTLDIESSEGKGTKIRLELPL